MRLPALALSLGLLLLSACSAPVVETTSYVPPANPGGRLCISQCREAQEFCRADCGLENRDCVGQVQAGAIQDYERYTREQFAARQPIELRPRDFERSAPCDEAKASCTARCERQYNGCYSNCGGQVNTSSSCQFMCF